MTAPRAEPVTDGAGLAREPGHASASLLYAAAQMYYEEDATQAEVAARLGTSRATVSRLLAEARRQGIVRISVVPPSEAASDGVGKQVAEALGLDAVYLSARIPLLAGTRSAADVLGGVLAPSVGRALTAARLVAGDVLLVSSGRTVYEVARFELPQFPGVMVAPTVGGTDQPEGWFQTNEITRRIAHQVGGRATYLFAPALPGPELYQTLIGDPAIQRVLHLWPKARCAVVGVGAPPMLRSEMPQLVPAASPALLEAVGDVCSRFFNRAGEPIDYPGSDRLIALQLADLQRLPAVVGVAAGKDKVAPIVSAARAGFVNQLVTDPLTAEQILASL